jgi:hypothetical protein
MEDSQEDKNKSEHVDEFTAKIMNALVQPNVLRTLASSLKNMCIEAAQEATKDLVEDISKLKTVDQEQEGRITNLEIAMDSYEQEKRKCGVVIRGLPETENENATKSIIDFAKSKLKIEVGEDDISIAFRVGQKTGNDEQNKYRPLKATFKNCETKESIMKAKSSLKGLGIKVWINDDLPPRVNCLAYCARKAVKEGKATMSWVTDSKVFIKVGQDGKPKKVQTEADLKKLKK